MNTSNRERMENKIGRGHFNDDDVAEVTKLASTGLVREPA
jgi:hypothetical protein